MKVLVIDDDIAARMVVEIRLSREGKHKVLTAPNGRKGLEIALRERLDCILLDIMMPKMNGFEVLNKLKKNPETSNIPVFMLTAKKDVDDFEVALRLGAEGYLTKPLDKVNLSEYLKTRLEKLKKERYRNL